MITKKKSDLIVLPLLMRLGPAFAKNLQADWLFVKAFWRLFWRLSKKYVFGVLSGSLLFVTSGAFDMASSDSSVHSILKKKEFKENSWKLQYLDCFFLPWWD